MRQLDVVVMLHSHLPYVLNHGRWPHGSDWICEAAIDTYLPLVEKLRALDAMNIAAPLTIGFTPILANQLEHPSFARELEAYFDQRLGFCDDAPESLEASGDGHLLPLVEFWRSRLVRLRLLFHELGRDIPREFRRLQDAERLEVTTSAATHGFLPLMDAVPQAVRAQVQVAVQHYKKALGRDDLRLVVCHLGGGGSVTARAGGNPLAVREHTAGSLFAKGPGSMTFRPRTSQAVSARAAWADGRWNVVLTRPLSISAAEGLPLASGSRCSIFIVCSW